MRDFVPDDADKEYPLTEKADQLQDQSLLYQQDNIQQQYTTMNQEPEKHYEKITNDAIGFMDESEDIQPKGTFDLTAQQVELIKSSTKILKSFGYEKAGLILFKDLLN